MHHVQSKRGNMEHVSRLGSEALELLTIAEVEARRIREGYLSTEHVLLAFFGQRNTASYYVLGR